MKKIIFSTLLAVATTGAVFASIPAGYYSSLVGKSGEQLKEASKQTGATGFEIITYGDKTWSAFETTDERNFDSRVIWFDMYSNIIQSVEAGHTGMNIEHSVPNSWWGGKTGSIAAYSDIVHLNPSNADANNRKSNNPLGEISGTPSWTNGITSIGAPTAVTGGGSATVFEPADEYKGDFARAYFYVFTVYNDIPWKSESAYMYDTESPLTLQPWAYQMLLDWSAMDPVDSREIKRNDEIYAIQGNRNPFIDLPVLAEYIWGEHSGEAFPASEIKDPTPVNRPDSPRPVGPDFNVTAVNGYTARWWNPVTISFAPFAEGVTGYYSINGGEAVKFVDSRNPEIEIDAAAEANEQMVIQVYGEAFDSGLKLNSAVTTVTLVARDPGVNDYSTHTWELLSAGTTISPDKRYLIVSTDTHHIMGAEKGPNDYIVEMGEVVVSDNRIATLPEGVGIVSFVGDGGTYTVGVSDITGKSKGYLTATAVKKMRLTDSGTAAEVSVNADGNAIIDFGGSLGTLQYNAQSPRFLNYTTNQKPIQLYVSLGELETGVVSPMVETGLQEIRVYDLTGRRCNPDALRPGIYIFVRGTEVTKEVVTR